MFADRAGGTNDPVRRGIPFRTAWAYGATSDPLHSSEVAQFPCPSRQTELYIHERRSWGAH